MKNTLYEIKLLSSLLFPPGHPDEANIRAALHYLGGLHALFRASPGELRALGLSSATRQRLLKLRRLFLHLLGHEKKQRINSPARSASAFAFLSLRPTEEVWLLCLDPGLRPIAKAMIARGGAAQCAVDSADILSIALRHRASRLILAHNHPSGDPTPSQTDRHFTQRIQDACTLIGLSLDDHLVIGRSEYHAIMSDHRGPLAPLLQSEPGCGGDTGRPDDMTKNGARPRAISENAPAP